MRRLIPVALMLVSIACTASQRAITDTGEEVLLHRDGTWTYANSATPGTTIQTNKQKFVKPADATFQLKSTRNNSSFFVNPGKWSFKKATSNEAAEYEFQLKGEDLYGMMICEGLELPVESLADIALTNARNVAPDAAVTKKEYRTVNGVRVIYMEMTGSIQGIRFTYFGYYHSDASGATQLLTYTSSNLAGKYRQAIDDLLNGFTAQPAL